MEYIYEKIYVFLFLILALVYSAFAYEPSFVVDEPFYQEIHIPYILPGDAANDVRKIAVDHSGQVWAATRDGIYSLEKDKMACSTFRCSKRTSL